MKSKSPFAQRVSWELSLNPLMAQLQALQKDNTSILDLTESNPTRCGFSYPKEILSALADPRNLSYQPHPQGQSNAREQIAGYYQARGIPVDPDKIFLTASTSEAYSFIFRLLCDQGQRVLVPAPSYPLFEFLVTLNDAQMDTYPLVYDQGWRIDLKELEKKITPLTKVIVLVHPNNPTGSYVKSEEMAAINALCRRHQITIICDEVFLDYKLKDGPAIGQSLAANKEVLTFILSGVAKSLGLPQMKLSWFLLNGPESLVAQARARLEIILDTYLSVNTPAQNALKAWLACLPRVQEDIRKRLKTNRDYLKAQGLECLESEGGWYTVVKLPQAHAPEEWAMALLKEDHVFVHPGFFFDFGDADPYIVLSLLPDPDTFREGIRRLRIRVENH